jgi:hypothetical protein
MQLQALLTVGWKTDPQTPSSAAQLHKTAIQAGGEYSDVLSAELKSISNDFQILGLEQLFRRHTDGFKPIKQFIGALVSLPTCEGYPNPLICHIDAFAYAFLKGAKNFDFLLPLGDEVNADFRNTHMAWSRTITSLEAFERVGEPLPKNSGVTAEQYLSLPKVIVRPSARDERGVLATLLVSGPSTLSEISTDLGLNYTLGQRTLATFEKMSVIERRPAEIFGIAEAALPLVVFCLREAMGIDLLSILPSED